MEKYKQYGICFVCTIFLTCCLHRAIRSFHVDGFLCFMCFLFLFLCVLPEVKATIRLGSLKFRLRLRFVCTFVSTGSRELQVPRTRKKNLIHVQVVQGHAIPSWPVRTSFSELSRVQKSKFYPNASCPRCSSNLSKVYIWVQMAQVARPCPRCILESKLSSERPRLSCASCIYESKLSRVQKFISHPSLSWSRRILLTLNIYVI